MNAQAQTIQRSQSQSANRAEKPHLRLVDGVVEQPVRVREFFYIHAARPMQGTVIQNDGSRDYLLQVFAMNADITPGKVRNMVFDEGQATYRAYNGHIATGKGTPGITPGYMYACIGTDERIDQAEGMLFPHPRIKTDTTRPRYGNHESMVQSVDQMIAAENALRESQRQKYAAPTRRNMVCGG